MISTYYLHEYDILDVFTESTYHIMNDVIDANKALIAEEQLISEKIFLGESVDGYDLVLEETKKNVFERIGDAVIAVFKAFGEMVDSFIKNVTGHIKDLRKKSSDKILKEQMEQNPELAQKFIDSVLSGNIKMNDVKDMDALMETASKLSKDLASGKIDEKTFSEKIDDALEKTEKKAKPIATILGIATSAFSLYKIISGIMNDSKTINHEAEKSRQEFEARKEEFLDQAKKEAEASGKGNKLSIWLSAQRKLMAKQGKNMSIMASIVEKASKFVSNINKNGYKKVNVGMDNRLRWARTEADEEDVIRTRDIEKRRNQSSKPNKP